MPARTGKCINFGGCGKADANEVLTIPDGAEFVCPECERALVATGGGRGKSGGGSSSGKLKLILFGLLGLGFIGAILAWLLIGSSPVIQNLAVEPTQIDAGQTATLKWSVEHATEVVIDPALGPVQPEDTFPVSPRGTTTYTLTAKSGSHLVTKSVTLQVNAAQQPITGPIPPPPVQVPVPILSGPPVIVSLTATPQVVPVGQTSVLQWSTSNTKSVSIPNVNPPESNLPPSGTINITPHRPGPVTILVVAVGQKTSVRRTIVIKVTGAGGQPNVKPVRRGPGLPPQRTPQQLPPYFSARPGTNQQPGQNPGMNQPPVNPGMNSQPAISQEQEQEPPPSAPASGVLIWEGEVQNTQLVTIQNGTASPGQLISGRLPGVQVILQPQNEKKVGIASAPSPDNHYQRVVLRVFGHGHTRVVINWSTP
jgi:hypothetical protein